MGTNRTERNTGNYYIGLDVGTNSVGWAVTDENYNIDKFKGNAMWGVRLFDEAQTAATRRTNRTARRRLERRKQRLLLLEMLFAPEIAKVDGEFINRIHESSLWADDKTSGCKYSLFNDKNFSDKDYYKKYPTIYHLRKELINSSEEHDVRLVYLSLHHIIKSRGHFLYEDAGSSDEVISVNDALTELSEFVLAEYGVEFAPPDSAEFVAQLTRNDAGITAKKKALKAAMGEIKDESDEVNLSSVVDMLAGATVKFSDMFNDAELKDAEVKSFCLKNDLDENFEEIAAVLGERAELIVQLKKVFDTARLSSILGGHKYISEAKVEAYEQNRADLRSLKAYVRKNAADKYKTIFSEKKEKLNNYAAYSGYELLGGAYTCSQEDFCKYLKSVIPEPEESDMEMMRIYNAIKDNSFLPKLKGSENGVIPYQLHKRELTAILDNASEYLPFLNSSDEDGLTVKDKIIKTFEFKIPYYVGTLNNDSKHYWAVRFAGKEKEKIYPWNFEKIVDTESSAGNFIDNLIGRCTYTGEKVLPKDSLLYSEYALLNELNPMKVNGRPLPVDVKHRLVEDLFVKSKKKVTKKRIREYLRSNGLIEESDEISGIDDSIKSSLKSFHDFKSIIDKTRDTEMIEDIIRNILVFGEDKKMLRKWLQKNTHDLDDADIKYVCRLKYNEWGRLSKSFLTEIYSPNELGEAKTIMDYLRESSCNLMQLLSSEYQFAENSRIHRDELFGNGGSLDDKLDNMYIAPAVRRSIRQTLKIVDEIVGIEKAEPKKVFIEMARDSAEDMKKKRTESRKEKLLALYKSCNEDSGVLFERLENEDENRLRSDKLYLYYTQMGKCMYSGETIDLESLAHGEGYDIDHIFPQSRIKDNSLDNRVLVKNTLNREKQNVYPINEGIRTKMHATWVYMKKQGLISQKKFDRLVRSYPLTDKELSDFIARQLVETQQSTKALAALIKDRYGENVRIVYSKAGNVSDFRREYDMIKCREVNDLHHAKDAYLNVVVGNVYCTKFTDKFFANIHSENYSLNKVFEYDVKGAWDKERSIATVRRHMEKNNALVTRMPREVKGQLFDLNIMPAGKGQLEKKCGLDINRYGGYNKLTGAYFCVVEHTRKKRRVRTIEPVYLYKKALFEIDPEVYCRDILALVEPKVIAKKVRMDSMLELNGERLYISGRTENRVRCKHSYQLCIDYKWEKYIKGLQKYVDRCVARKTELPITEHDGITTEENKELYSIFIDKCDAEVYKNFLKNMKNDMVSYKEVFEAKSIFEQTKLLLEILKAFKCNAQLPNLTALCGKGSVGQIMKGSNIGELDSAFLVNQSVTGLYENRINLLK